MRGPGALNDPEPSAVGQLPNTDTALEPGVAPRRRCVLSDHGSPVGLGCGLFHRPAIVDEEHPTVVLQGIVNELPEGSESTGRNVREPEAKDDRVKLAGRMPGEQISVNEGDLGVAGYLGSGDSQSLDGGVHSGEALSDRCNLAGQVAGAGGEFQDVPCRVKSDQRLLQCLLPCVPPMPEVVIGLIAPGAQPPIVVFGSAGFVVGDLLRYQRIRLRQLHDSKIRLPASEDQLRSRGPPDTGRDRSGGSYTPQWERTRGNTVSHHAASPLLFWSTRDRLVPWHSIPRAPG